MPEKTLKKLNLHIPIQSACDRTLKMIEEYGFKDRVVINSFDGRFPFVRFFKTEQGYKEFFGKLKKEKRRGRATSRYCLAGNVTA